MNGRSSFPYTSRSGRHYSSETAERIFKDVERHTHLSSYDRLESRYGNNTHGQDSPTRGHYLRHLQSNRGSEKLDRRYDSWETNRVSFREPQKPLQDRQVNGWL